MQNLLLSIKHLSHIISDFQNIDKIFVLSFFIFNIKNFQNIKRKEVRERKREQKELQRQMEVREKLFCKTRFQPFLFDL